MNFFIVELTFLGTDILHICFYRIFNWKHNVFFYLLFGLKFVYTLNDKKARKIMGFTYYRNLKDTNFWRKPLKLAIAEGKNNSRKQIDKGGIEKA